MASPTESARSSRLEIGEDSESEHRPPSCSPHPPPINTSSISNFLEMFFNVAYFLCLFPFRFVKKKDNSTKLGHRFCIHTSWPQNVICATLTLLSLFWLIRDIRICVPSTKSPAAYVQLALALLDTLVRLVMIKNLWFHKDAFLDIINFVTDHSTSYVFAQKRKLFGIAGIYTIMGLVLFLTIRGDSKGGGIIHDWSEDRWVKSLIHAGRYNFFVTNMPFPYQCATANQTIRAILDKDVDDFVYAVDGLLLILAGLGSYSRHLQGAFGEFLLLMVVLTLWTAVKNYCDKIKAGVRQTGGGKSIQVIDDKKVSNGNTSKANEEDGDNVSIEFSPVGDTNSEWKEIHGGFQFLKKLSDLINIHKAMGLYVTLCIAGYVLYYAVFFDLVFAEGSEKDFGRRVELIMFLISTCIILLLCADLSHRMITLKVWLGIKDNRKGIPTDEVVIIFNQIDLKRVAISGSKIFPITYQTLFGMVGVMATYFILCVKDKGLADQVIKC